MKNKIAILFVLCIFSTTAFSQKDIELDNIKTKHFIGLHAGNTTGFGFSYRYWPTKLGCQITSIPIFGQDFYNVNIGISLLYTLKDNKKVDLYSYFGNRLQFDGYETNQYDNFGNVIATKKTAYTTYNIGLGIGFKIDLLEVLDINFQTGYALNDITDSFYTGLAGEIGLYYQL